MKFLNRTKELQKLREDNANLSVLFGRRRVGKTALVMEFGRLCCKPSQLFYTQAIEGAESLQISQICEEVAPLLPHVPVNTWPDFLQLLSKNEQKKCVLIIDEFPYLVKTQPSLPSMLQRWLDHHCPQEMRLILLGSSQTMMHDIFLKGNAPLYERAGEILHIRPMEYKYFCEAKELDPLAGESYLLFSMVGGVPKYWEYIDKKRSSLDLADQLYFEVGSRLENEPERLLKDENIVGEQAKSILELVGRGVHRPSEIASRMGIKQTSLSNPLILLRDASLVLREIPFGENARNTKRSLYKIHDHCLSFWYSCYSPHRVKWLKYSTDTKRKIIHDHASLMFERDYRSLFRDASRYWDSSAELDSVRYADETDTNLIVSEIKFRELPSAERKQIASHTLEKFNQSQLAAKFRCQIEVIGLGDGLRALLA